jgi:glycosyltransferase involved in cell wall biosynthesis
MSGTYDPNGPLRVAYLTYRGKPHVGGQGVYTRHLTKALADLGHTVEVFGGQPYPVLDDRITMHKLPSLDIFNDTYPGRVPAYWEIKTWPDVVETARFMTGQFSEPLAFSKRALRTLTPRVNDFDLVHDNQCLGWDILKIEKMIPTIVTLHHPITKDRELEMSHAPSRWKRRSVGRWYSFVDMQGKVASKMPRIVVGVDPDLFKPQPHIAREPGRLITTASADVALKGLSYLLEAMALLRKDRDIRLTIIGKPRPGHSMDLIDSLGLRPHIDFVSGVTDERIVELYAEAELAVVPSLYEGFSLPAIEAMSTGICLVATDGGALPEVTGTHNETVLQCPAANAEALATAIATGLDSAELRARIGEAGRQRVVSRWTWKHCAELTVEQYREVLDMPHNRAKLEKRR